MELPASAQELADVIGRDRALYLIGQLPRSGSRTWRCNLYVPKTINPDHKLVQLIGWSDACKLVREFGGMILQPANCEFLHRQFRNAEVRRMRDRGDTIAVIADAVALTQRQVRNILAETPPEEIPAMNDNLPDTRKRTG